MAKQVVFIGLVHFHFIQVPLRVILSPERYLELGDVCLAGCRPLQGVLMLGLSGHLAGDDGRAGQSRHSDGLLGLAHGVAGHTGVLACGVLVYCQECQAVVAVLLVGHNVWSVGVYCDTIFQPGDIGMGNSMDSADYFFFFSIFCLDQNIFNLNFRSICKRYIRLK